MWERRGLSPLTRGALKLMFLSRVALFWSAGTLVWLIALTMVVATALVISDDDGQPASS